MAANLQACSFLLGRLEREVVRLRAIPFPGHDTGPRKWLGVISGLLDTAASYLARAASPGTTPAETAQLVKDAEKVGNDAYQLLTFVAGADSTQIPHQVVAPFQRWVDALGIKQTIFFRAEHLPNYELTTIDGQSLALLNGASQTLVDAIAAINWPVLRVSVPGHAMGLLPHFAVVAHELGHAIQDRIRLDLSGHHQDLTDFLARTVSRLAQEGITFKPEHGVTAGEILGRWVNELKADAVGHHLVGPAYFFALCGFLELSNQGYGIGPTHPPSDLRRSLLFGKLSEGLPSFEQVFQAKTGLGLTEEFNSPHIAKCLPPDQMYAELKQRHDVVTAAICVELMPAIAALAQTVFAAAHAELQASSAALVYTPAQLAVDLDRHLELLCNLIPPVEFQQDGAFKPCTLASILNVGWCALLTKVDLFPKARGLGSSSPDAARMECLHELLLKAVELAETRQLWEEHA